MMVVVVFEVAVKLVATNTLYRVRAAVFLAAGDAVTR